MAKIDVLLPVRNGIAFLAESLDSISAQSFRDWRLLVLDHGSTDGSREMAESYRARDSRIEVHSVPSARGLAGLLNYGLSQCDCDYVMRHDADDICYPDRMAVALAAFRLQPQCVLIGGQAESINAFGDTVGKVSVPVGRTRVTAASLFRNPVTHPSAMMCFNAIERLGARYGADFLKVLPAEMRIEISALAEDYFLFGQLALIGKCTNVPSSLIRYRWHGGNVSVTRFREQMEASLCVSRFLTRTFCAMHEMPYVDPAPFCNHGGQLFDVDGKVDFEADFGRLSHVLRQGLGLSDELERELQFRRTAATRRPASLLWRYYRFRALHAAETGEWNAVRSWLLRRLPGRCNMTVSAEVGAWEA